MPRTEPGCSFIVVPKERTRRFRMCEESVRDDLQTSDLVEPGGEIESTDRVEVKQGDARKLPFADQTFDVVVSNFVVHEMKTKADRETMMHEIARVLKPGRRVALVDFIFTDKCVDTLRKFGVETERARDGFVSFWISVALNFGAVKTYHVFGQKTTGDE